MMFRVAPLETVCVARKFSNWNVECESGKLFKLSVKFQQRSSMSIVEIPLGCEFYANQKQTKHKKLDVSLCWCCADGKSGNSWVNSEVSRAEMGANLNNGQVWRREGIIMAKRMCIHPLIFSLLLFEHNWIKFELWIITASSLTHR